jgi:hypothetical protein
MGEAGNRKEKRREEIPQVHEGATKEKNEAEAALFSALVN